MSGRWRWRSLAIIAIIAPFCPTLAQRAPLAMLDQLESGQWEVRLRGNAEPRRMCLRDARQLIQLRHPAETCERLIVEDSASDVTVQYTCRGRGYGRTHIRRESARLAQIDTQGIAAGLPFAESAEARRVGDCPG